MMKTLKLRCISATYLLIIAFILSPAAAFAQNKHQPSTWALEKMSICEKAGILPKGFDSKPFTDSITRKDFTEIIVNACRIFGASIPELPAEHPFEDTMDSNAESAYMLGLIRGTSPGVFDPDKPLTREMAAVVLSRVRMLFQSYPDNVNNHLVRTNYRRNRSSGNLISSENHYSVVYTTPEGTLAYEAPMDEEPAFELLRKYSSDSAEVSDWAKIHMADVYSLGLLNGIGAGRTNPKGNITREQAAVLALNVLTFCDDSQIRNAGVDECVIPVPTGIYISPSYYTDGLLLRWNQIPSASEYDVTLLKDGTAVYSVRTSNTFLDLRTSIPEYDRESGVAGAAENEAPLYNAIFGSDKTPVHAGIKVTPVDSSGIASMFSLDKMFTIIPFSNKNELITGDTRRQQFSSRSEADDNMRNIIIKVWKLNSQGEKVASESTLTVNKNVAEDVVKIFDEIFNGPEKFPIKNVSAYAFRDGSSQHSNGTAIDINPNENYFVTWEGKILSDSFWKPGENPYSIIPGGDVVRAFNRYGWHWSPDMKWPNGADYMHFSLTGK
jgi:hypothetical protein